MNPDSLEKLFLTLNKARVRYLVVGGLAVLAHGYLRMTRDIDLVIALDRDNPKRALECFAELGYQPNLPVELMDFTDPAKRRAWQQEEGMQVYQLVSDSLVDCPVDIFVEEPIAFTQIYPARVEYQISETLKIPVIGLKHLKQLKQAAGRPRDLLDLEELEHLNVSDD